MVEPPVRSSYAAYTRHVNPTVGRFLELSGRDTHFVSARGTTLFDEDGLAYQDWVAGFGSANLGHNPESLKETIRQHLSLDAPNLFPESLNPYSGELAARLVQLLPGFSSCFFVNSGSEAVEAGIKTALLSTGRSRIVYADRGYHGTTLGALACMGASPYRANLDAALAPFREVPFGNLAALEAALAEDGGAAAFLLEPVQVEAGVRIATRDYLEGVRRLCDRNGALLILDEVQTGMGRTGSLFAFEQTGCRPDILLAAKSLGGGLMPIGAALFAEGLWERAYSGLLRAELLSSTFGGNTLACRVALKTLDLIADPAFLASVRERGEELFGDLGEALRGSPVVERISCLGLLGGIQLREPEHPSLRWEGFGLPELSGHPVSGALLVERLARRRILVQVCAHDWSVVRIEPPLVVDQQRCREFVEAVRDAVSWLEEHD